MISDQCELSDGSSNVQPDWTSYRIHHNRKVSLPYVFSCAFECCWHIQTAFHRHHNCMAFLSCGPFGELPGRLANKTFLDSDHNWTSSTKDWLVVRDVSLLYVQACVGLESWGKWKPCYRSNTHNLSFLREWSACAFSCSLNWWIPYHKHHKETVCLTCVCACASLGHTQLCTSLDI